MPVDPTNTRSSSFWATLGQGYLQIAETVLPQLGQSTSEALAARFGGTAPDTTVTPPDTTPGAPNTSKFLLIGLAIFAGLIVFASILRRR